MVATADCASSSVIGRCGPNRDDRIHGRFSHSTQRAEVAAFGKMTEAHLVADRTSVDDPR
jgi:hypothetical protein